MRVKEEEAAGKFRQQKLVFAKQMKPKESHRLEVLLFDHDFGTVITVSSSSFPGNRCSRLRVEFLFSLASAAIRWQTLQWQPGPPRAPLAKGQPGLWQQPAAWPESPGNPVGVQKT